MSHIQKKLSVLLFSVYSIEVIKYPEYHDAKFAGALESI